MNKSNYLSASALVLGIVLCAFNVGAQTTQAPAQAPNQTQAPGSKQDQSVAPIPAYHSPLASDTENSDGLNPDDSQNIVPDNRALSGARGLTLGSREISRSYWEPYIDIVATANSNALSSTGGWTTNSSILGGINAHKVSGHSDMTLGYQLGEIVSNDGDTGNSLVQQLNFAEVLSTHRLKISFLDNMQYLPQASLGYGFAGGVELPGGGFLGLQSDLTPENSVLTTRGQRVDNSFLTEGDMALSPRSSVSLVGGYSLLTYLDNSLNLFGFTTATGQIGYNRKVSPKNTLAISYRFNAIRYDNIAQTINDNLVHVTYGRTVTGRLAFELAAGPEYSTFSIPILTSGTGTATSGSQLNWSASAALTYQLRRGTVRADYFHSVGGGSGVLAGSLNDTFTASGSKQISRTFIGTLDGGYARNRGLVIPGAGVFDQTYNYAFSDLGFTHPLGRTLNVYATYEFQYQFSSVSFCAGIKCGSNIIAHLISVGVHWQGRPMLF